ncbi:hypothetical protein SDJN03_09413, partial [Cucurbita argyrosperma subsp. sororia]
MSEFWRGSQIIPRLAALLLSSPPATTGVILDKTLDLRSEMYRSIIRRRESESNRRNGIESSKAQFQSTAMVSGLRSSGVFVLPLNRLALIAWLVKHFPAVAIHIRGVRVKIIRFNCRIFLHFASVLMARFFKSSIFALDNSGSFGRLPDWSVILAYRSNEKLNYKNEWRGLKVYSYLDASSIKGVHWRAVQTAIFTNELRLSMCK